MKQDQSTLDALVDAETLSLYCNPSAKNSEAKAEIYLGISAHYGRVARYWLVLAVEWTGRGRDNDPDRDFLWDDRCDRAYLAAFDAAHAAFLAVPGLR